MRKRLVVIVLATVPAIAAADNPKVAFDAPTVTGALGAKTVTATVKRSTRKLLACYKKELAATPGLAGTVMLKFTIGGDGKVTASSAGGLNASIRACVAAVIKKIRFAVPADKQPVEVVYPLELESTQSILGSMALHQGGAFASLTGTGDVSSAFDDTTIYGGLLGNEAGEMEGGFGYGRTGSGTGGGGTGWGTIGTGRYGNIGSGSGYGVGSGRGGMRGRSVVPRTSIGQPSTSSAALDKAIIRRYIKRSIQKILYCYEKELLTTPKLHGTVTVEFTIGTDGRVSASAAGGMKSANVEGCIARVIKAIEFPKPKSGEVVVKYPFTFRPAADDAKPPAKAAEPKPTAAKPVEPKPAEPKPAEPKPAPAK